MSMIEILNDPGDRCDKCGSNDGPFAGAGRFAEFDEYVCLACARKIVHAIERAILEALDRKAQDALDAANKARGL